MIQLPSKRTWLIEDNGDTIGLKYAICISQDLPKGGPATPSSISSPFLQECCLQMSRDSPEGRRYGVSGHSSARSPHISARNRFSPIWECTSTQHKLWKILAFLIRMRQQVKRDLQRMTPRKSAYKAETCSQGELPHWQNGGRGNDLPLHVGSGAFPSALFFSKGLFSEPRVETHVVTTQGQHLTFYTGYHCSIESFFSPARPKFLTLNLGLEK